MSATSGTRILGTGAPAKPASWLAKTLALTGHELRLAMRRGESLLVTFVIPVGVLLVFSTLNLGGTDKGVDQMLPGSMSLAIIAAAMVSLSIATAFERSYGVLKRLGGSPSKARGPLPPGRPGGSPGRRPRCRVRPPDCDSVR